MSINVQQLDIGLLPLSEEVYILSEPQECQGSAHSGQEPYPNQQLASKSMILSYRFGYEEIQVMDLMWISSKNA